MGSRNFVVELAGLKCRLRTIVKSLTCERTSDLGPVHTYTDIFESATFSLRIRLPSTRIRRIRQQIRKKINTLSKVEKNISATNPLTCGRVNPDIFLSDDVKSVSSLSPNNSEFKQTTTATVTIATPNKRFNEQNNNCARAF